MKFNKINQSIWHRHPFHLLLYLEWILLGITLLGALGGLIPHPHLRHRSMVYPAWSSLLGFTCIALLSLMGLKLPYKVRWVQQIYITSGFLFSLAIALLIRNGERILPILLLVVAIRACLLFSWTGRIVVATLAYLSFLGIQVLPLTKFNLLGVSWYRPLPPILRRLPPEELRRVIFGWALNSALMYGFVLAFVLLLVGAVISEHDSRTRLIQAHRRLRKYALQIENQATLQERNRIAREIHDSVGHYLTAQSIQLENTALFLESDRTKAVNHLTKARQLGTDALASIRASVSTLRKNPLQERSITASIERLIAEFKLNTGIEIVHHINLTSALSYDLNIALFRIIQEALTNIAKHSQATKVRLDLQETNGQLCLSIQDDGCGFNPNNNTTGFGLQGMKERTFAFQGEISISSKPEQGASINVTIPLSLNDYQLSLNDYQ